MAAQAIDMLAAVSAKRRRDRKFREFGEQLEKWRGDRDIEEVVRKVREFGVDFDGATLRGWEYGWTGAPDPMRLLALAQVLGKTSEDVLQALAIARKIDLPKDLSRHSSATTSASNSSSSGGAVDTTSRKPPAINPADYADAVRDITNRLARLAIAIEQGVAPERAESGRRRGHRKTG